MIGDKDGIGEILRKYLSGKVPEEKLREVVEEITALGEGWEEVTMIEETSEGGIRYECEDDCIAELYRRGVPLRFFRRKQIAGE